MRIGHRLKPRPPNADLKAVIDDLALRDPKAITSLKSLNQRLKLALDGHIIVASSLSTTSPETETSTSAGGPNGAFEDISIIVKVLRGVSPGIDSDPDQDDELKAAFEALRIAFGEQEDLPKDNAEFLEFAARKLE